MKKIIFVVPVFLTSFSLMSQTLKEIVSKTENENFDAAAINFRTLIALEPNKGENYFFFGENYFNKGDIDSANYFYLKGIEFNATCPLNYVGIGKVLLVKNNLEEAQAQFFKGKTLAANKNAEFLRRNAEAWLVTNNKNTDEAIVLINAAIKMEPKTSENYIILGDALLEKNPANGSEPIKSYNKATELNPKSAKGRLRIGKLFQRGRNYPLAIEKYKEAIALEPTFAPAYRELAEVYSLYAKHASAIENWKKYLELNNNDDARYRFMSALYSNKQYQDAITEYEALKKQGYKSLFLERLAGYSYYEIGNKNDADAYNKGLKALDSFFDQAGNGFKYLHNDYKYKGLLLCRLGKDTLGILELEKALAIDSIKNLETFSELASVFMKMKSYDKAIISFNRKIQINDKAISANDYFALGKAHFFSGINIQKEANDLKEVLIKKKKPADSPEIKLKESSAVTFFVNADSAFSRLTQISPSWPIGYFWRGRANSYLDPKNEKWLAKPHYEKLLSLIKPEERKGSFKSNVIEALEYFGDYYVNIKDKIKADENWNAIKELDPTNEKAKFYFAPLKTKGKN